MKRLVLRLGLATAAVLGASACGGDSTPATTEPTPSEADLVVGVYTLQTINDQSLPFLVIQQGEDKLEITAGTVTLSSDRSFSDVTALRLTLSGEVTTETDVATGTWQLNATTVVLTPTNPADASPYSMTWDRADRLTQVVDLGEGLVLTIVYMRPAGT